MINPIDTLAEEIIDLDLDDEEIDITDENALIAMIEDEIDYLSTNSHLADDIRAADRGELIATLAAKLRARAND